MRIQLNYKSGVPPYLQITEQVKFAVASGVLSAGEELPSIRPMAERLRVNRNTVAKAYSQLEQEGVIETRPGKPSVISGKQTPYRQEMKESVLNELIDAAIVQAHHFQVGSEELKRILESRLRRFRASGTTDEQDKHTEQA